MIGALSRTRPLLKPKGEVSMAMVKWWKKKRPQDAEVRNNKRRRSIDTFFHATSRRVESNRRGRQTDHRRIDGDHHGNYGSERMAMINIILPLTLFISLCLLLITPFRLRCTFPLTNSSLFFPGSRLSRRRLSIVSPPTFGRLALSQWSPEARDNLEDFVHRF
jgi:hypothetical protein